MKVNFYQSNKKEWGDLQMKVSELMVHHLSSGKDFYVAFGTDKTPAQLRGFHRICELLAPYMSESEGVFFDKSTVKELVKQECNYCAVARGRLLTKSVAKASRDEMRAMIEKLYELGAFYKVPDYKLTSAEKKALVEYYGKQ